jgi:hypothetical protein
MSTVRWNSSLASVIAAAAMCMPQPASALQCIEYGPVRLVGTLVRQTYAGPPDFESVTKGDEPQTIWVLQLEERACVYSRSRAEREYEQDEIQLEVSPVQIKAYQQLLGQRLIVEGDLIRGGARHEKRLVLVVTKLNEASAMQDRKNAYAAECRCYTRL